MRYGMLAILGALGMVVTAQGANAEVNGGLGPQPPAFMADLFQPAPATPYGAVCVAPPVSCEVRYMYPIRPGKACWCRSGMALYSAGVTHPWRQDERSSLGN